MTSQSGPDAPGNSRIDPREIIRLFDQASAFMAYLRGPDYCIEYGNAAYIKIIGGRDVIGRTLAEALPDVEREYRPLLDEAYRTGLPMRVNGSRYDRQLEPGGPMTEHYVDFVYQPILDNDGRVEGILLQGGDVTERVLAERAVIEARNAAEEAQLIKAEFVSQLNHDVRAPMSATLSLVDILSATQPLTPEQREYLRILRMSADSVLTQVNDMVDSARIESRGIILENVSFRPAVVLREAANAITVPARDKGLELEVRVEVEDDACFTGDPGRIRQVLTLLCAHALRVTEAGRISLRVHQDDGQALVFQISDTSPGMTAEALDTVFDRAVHKTAAGRYAGNGLGLTMSRIVADMMGGSIMADSTLDEGTTFTLRLPLLAADGAEADGETPEAASLDRGELAPVLVVEDYEPNILIVTTYLEQMGFRFDVVKNGKAAVAKAKSGTYALALMDVQMPGLNGLDATRLIREHETETGHPHLPIVGVTAHSLAIDRQRCLEAGMDEFLSKPFNATELQEKIFQLLPAA